MRISSAIEGPQYPVYLTVECSRYGSGGANLTRNLGVFTAYSILQTASHRYIKSRLAGVGSAR